MYLLEILPDHTSNFFLCTFQSLTKPILLMKEKCAHFYKWEDITHIRWKYFSRKIYIITERLIFSNENWQNIISQRQCISCFFFFKDNKIHAKSLWLPNGTWKNRGKWNYKQLSADLLNRINSIQFSKYFLNL